RRGLSVRRAVRAGGGPGRWRGWDSGAWPANRRPSWWPEGEPFPYRRYRYGPPTFVRWIGCFIVLVLGVAFLTGGLAGALFGRLGSGGFHPFFAFPLALLILLVAAAAFGGMRRLSQPMNNLIEAARRIEAGDYSAQVPEWGSPDVRSVARAFNSMAGRLKTIDEQRRSFMADVTHELRTPLSVIRGQAEAINDGVYPPDAARIRQVIVNLLSNAIRHTPSGGSVTVAVTAPATVTVTDTGEGIPPELLPHVFDRFAKGANSPGSGLGLAIAHDIVRAHGGKLEIVSTSGQGTSARVSLDAL